MAAPGHSNVVARRAIDEIVEFSGKAKTPKYMKVFILQQIAESRRFLRMLRDEADIARSCNPEALFVARIKEVVVLVMWKIAFTGSSAPFALMPYEFSLRRLKVTESSCLSDKMKVVFVRARSEDESFAGLMCDLCFSLRISLSKKRMLVAELEALGERGDAVRSLEHMGEIVARDYMTLRDLEQLLACAHVGMSLKDGYVADMEEKE
nr:hypothetical protein [Tanacetum cinerariifolium]